MNYPDNVWKQIRNISTNELIKALLKDGFVFDRNLKTERIYRRSDGRKVSIHYHSGSANFGSHLLKNMLNDINWTVDDLRRLKLIK